MCDNMKGNHMKCMSIALNNEWKSAEAETFRLSNVAYNVNNGNDLNSILAYDESIDKLQSIERLMHKHDQGLAEHYRKRELKSKLGVK